ncbi:TIGR00282 family metallophosphoesterase [Candidatus Dependentiae bacterium]|nr:TIGR00282 family metallophosphoesterase [Candidatus Dependentiae bacterium]
MQNKDKIRILMFGDVVGGVGRMVLQKHLPHLKEKYKADAVIVNGENSAEGKGITSRIMKFYRHIGVDVVTSGNHIWQKREIYNYFGQNKDLLRPANFPSECPGSGITFFQVKGYTVAVMNIQGRVFMRELLSCPFKTADSQLTFLKSKTNIILVDFHAETTSEKHGIGFYLDGKVSAVVGTHTHVQTADERILPGGTAYITDLGMAGSYYSMIGMKKDPIINHMITQMPQKFEVETEGPYLLCGVSITIDANSGKAESIERIFVVDNELKYSGEHEE